MKIFFILATALFLSACGKNSDANAEGGAQVSANACTQLSGEEAGKKIAAIALKAYTKTAEMVKSQPDGDTIEAEYTKLLESWQIELIHVGQHLLNLDATELQKARSAVSSMNSDLQYNAEIKPIFEAYSKGIYPYFSSHRELHKKMQSINIITQFAFFDLLKKQNKDAETKWGELMIPFKCAE